MLGAVVAAGSMTPQALAEGVENGNRPFYGFFLSNGGYTNASEEQYGFARQTFAEPWENTLIHELSGGVGVYAATAVDGIYYAAPYLYQSSMSMPTPMPLFSYNIYTGLVREIGPWSDGSTDLKPSDMTYDIKNDRILATCYGSQQGGGIYEINRQTGEMKLVCKPDNVGGVIAADAFGRLFSINHNGELIQIDPARDNASRVIYTMPYKFLSSNQSLEFDFTSGKLYWGANTLENPHNDKGISTWLVEISLPSISPDMDYSADMTGYSYEEIGEIGWTARFMGMYIPYATGGFDAPGFATDLTSVSGTDGSCCTIGFKVPATTFGGSALESIDGYDLYREGERIHTCKGPFAAGAELSYDDMNVPESGREYRYDVVCYSNTKGDGPKSPVFAYVGMDAPEAPSTPKVVVSDDFMSATISWTAPANGLHGGAFDPSQTTYDIVRLPDNVVVAKDIKDCTVKDSFRRLLRYSYRITAKNEFGYSDAATAEFIAGTPVSEFPVEENFENPTAMALRWNSVDNNGDGMTWIYGTTLGQSVFGDYEMTAEYIISPTSVDIYTKDADDWIISPPIKFEEGKKYYAAFDIRSLTNERLNVYVGPKNTVEGMTRIYTFTLNRPEYADDERGTMLFQRYATALPDDIAGTTACVAIQLATPLNDQYYSYIQLGCITIDEGVPAGTAEIAADEACSYRLYGRDLTLSGEFSNAAVYTLGGIRVRDIHGVTTSLEGLNGLYILVIDGKAYKIVVAD